MPSLGERIKSARKGAKLKLRDIGEACGGKSPQAVSQWETNQTAPSAADLGVIAARTGVTLEWLLYGGAPPSDDAHYDSAGNVGRVVPSIEWEDLARYQSGDRSAISGYVRSHFPCSKNAFRTTVRDRANEPKLLIDDSIIVDPEKRPSPGEFCLAFVDGEYIIRRYTLRGKDIVLVPVNQDWPSVDATADDIVGLITEFSRQRIS
jgi:transcriptional regulator with XRE-family HTH domain